MYFNTYVSSFKHPILTLVYLSLDTRDEGSNIYTFRSRPSYSTYKKSIKMLIYIFK